MLEAIGLGSLVLITTVIGRVTLGSWSPQAIGVPLVAFIVVMSWKRLSARQMRQAEPEYSSEELAVLRSVGVEAQTSSSTPGSGIRRVGVVFKRQMVFVLIVTVIHLALRLTGLSAQPVLRDWPGQDSWWEAAYTVAMKEDEFEEALSLNRQRQRKPLRSNERVVLELEEVNILSEWGYTLRAAGQEEVAMERLTEAYNLATRREQMVQAEPLSTAIAPTFTPTPTDTPTNTPTPTSTSTPTPTSTSTPTPTSTNTPTDTPEPTSTPTPQPTWTRQPTYTPPPSPTPEPDKPPLDYTRCADVTVENPLGVSGVFRAWDCGTWGFYGDWKPSEELNPVGGELPQPYHSGAIGSFKLCPPVEGQQLPYTAKVCQ